MMDFSYFKNTRFFAALFISLIVLFCIISNKISSGPYSLIRSITNNDYFKSNLADSSVDVCQWKFDHYTSSPWEVYWYNNIDNLQNNVCGKLKENDQLSKSIRALEYIINFQKTISNEFVSSNESDELLSKMYYRLQCSNSTQSNLIVSQYIEPLIGLLRDPLTMCPYNNIPANLQIHGGNAVQSKRFFLLGPSAPFQNFRLQTKSIAPWLYRPGSQTILFDLGSSYFNGMTGDEVTGSALGTRWFYEYFRSNSLKFDRIIAFEATQYTPKTYWKQIPDDIIGSLTFINTGVETTDKFNPWNILKSTAKINDYVIIKLDIDTSGLENELIQQVLNNKSIYELIDEMFFEMHVTVNEMKPYWGSPPGQLKDTYTIFNKLRQLGIRMHSWP